MNLENICRLCLEACDQEYSILENGIHNKVMLCLNLEIQLNSLPKHICKNCRYQLEKTYVFRTTSKICERKLRKHIRLTNSGKESVLKPPSKDINDEENDDEIYEFNQSMLESYRYFEDIEKEKDNILSSKLEDFEKEKQEFLDKTKKNFENKLNLLKEKYEKETIEFREKETNRILENMKKFLQNETTPKILTVQSKYEPENSTVIEYYDEEMTTKESESDSMQQEFFIEEEEVDENLDAPEKIQKKVFLNQNQLTSQETEVKLVVIEDKTEPKRDIEYYTIEDDEMKLISQSPEKKYEFYNVVEEEDEVNDQDTKKTPQVYYQTVPEAEADAGENGEKRIFQCVKCPLRFTSRQACKQHFSEHENVHGLECHFCKKLFKTNSALQRHIRCHTKERPFICSEPGCGKCFSQNEVLKRHMITHSTNYCFACDVEGCEKKFKSKELLKQHQKTHDGVAGLHTCSFCEKTFQFASGLSRHIRLHSGRVLSCSTCDRKFSDKSSYKRHQKTVHLISEN